jgi:hypothetical protein
VIASQTGTVLYWKFPVHFDRRLTLAISASPGPQSITAATGSSDTRSVSVQLVGPLVKLRGEPLLGEW